MTSLCAIKKISLFIKRFLMFLAIYIIMCIAESISTCGFVCTFAEQYGNSVSKLTGVILSDLLIS